MLSIELWAMSRLRRVLDEAKRALGSERIRLWLRSRLAS